MYIGYESQLFLVLLTAHWFHMFHLHSPLKNQQFQTWIFREEVQGTTPPQKCQETTL